MKERAWAAATVACCSAGFYLRWLNAHVDLESPSVDENDVVQQAVAFLGGEWPAQAERVTALVPAAR